MPLIKVLKFVIENSIAALIQICITDARVHVQLTSFSFVLGPINVLPIDRNVAPISQIGIVRTLYDVPVT